MTTTKREILLKDIEDHAIKSGAEKVKWYGKLANKYLLPSGFLLLTVAGLFVAKLLSFDELLGQVTYLFVNILFCLNYIFSDPPMRTQKDFERKNKLLRHIEGRTDLNGLMRPALVDMAGNDLKSAWYFRLDTLFTNLFEEERREKEGLVFGDEMNLDELKNQVDERAEKLVKNATELTLEKELTTASNVIYVKNERWRM